ncbi:MAG: S1C family serine protease [Nitrososphaeraceae archaeon]
MKHTIGSVLLVFALMGILSINFFIPKAIGQNLIQMVDEKLSFNDLFELVENSVVQITRTVPSTGITPAQENTTALGSGFIYSDEGYIITNNHVVENTKTVDITFIDGERYTANVTGTDLFSDLAVIKINENVTDLPSSLKIGNSSMLKVGDIVVAVGNPFGLQGSMTTGIVSQIGRLLSVHEEGFSIPNAIQTDALINPGNSGGPLLNLKGEVVGVNTAGIFPGSIGLAVPSDTVLRIVPVLIEHGNYTHPWLGITGATLTADLAKREKIDRDQKGVIIDSIVKDSPADKAGLNGSTTNQYGEKIGGDLITAVDNNKIIKIEDLISYLEVNKSVNDTATITVLRNGDTLDKEITLDKRPLIPPTVNQE